MIHIILSILKIIGILLLVLLVLLLLLLLAVLFWPIKYRMKIIKKTQQLEGKLIFSWLFGLLWVRAGYKDGKTEFNIRILGIPVEYLRKTMKLIGRAIAKAASGIKKVIPRRPRQKAVVISASEPETKQKDERKTTAKKPAAAPKPDPLVKPELSLWQRFKRLIRLILGIPAAIADFIKKIYLTIRSFCGKIKHWQKLITGESTKAALRFLLGEGAILFRHIRPKKIVGMVKFGFEDPAITGQLLAAVSMIYPIYKKGLQIVPVFDDRVLELDLFLKGRIQGWLILKTAWQIYRNQHIKTTIHEFQHKEA